MKKFTTAFAAAAAATLIAAGITTGCSKSGPDTPGDPHYIEVNTTTVNFTEENASNSTVMVNSNVDWDYTVSESWLHAEKQPDRLVLSADDNDDKNIRSATVEITAPNVPTQTIQVKQLGWGKAILLSESKATVSASGGKVTVGVTTNIEVEASVAPDCNWIYETEVDTRSSAHPVVTATRAFSIDGNTGEGSRSAAITFSDKQSPSDVEPVTFTIEQRGLDSYSPEGTEGIKDDIKLVIARGEASSYQPGRRDRTVVRRRYEHPLPLKVGQLGRHILPHYANILSRGGVRHRLHGLLPAHRRLERTLHGGGD